ncbi:hypothetical protein [Chitinimonas arctica]
MAALQFGQVLQLGGALRQCGIGRGLLQGGQVDLHLAGLHLGVP